MTEQKIAATLKRLDLSQVRAESFADYLGVPIESLMKVSGGLVTLKQVAGALWLVNNAS